MKPTIEDKRVFIRWVLNNFQIKRRECVWILNYLMESVHLEHTVFIDGSIEMTPLGLYIPDQSTEGKCMFYNGGKSSEDMERAWHKIRARTGKDKLYIRFDLKLDTKDRIHYLNVIEDNEFVPITATLHRKVDTFLIACDYYYKKNKLTTGIDKALEIGDKETFMQLSSELNKLGRFSPSGIEIIKSKDKSVC